MILSKYSIKMLNYFNFNLGLVLASYIKDSHYKSIFFGLLSLFKNYFLSVNTNQEMMYLLKLMKSQSFTIQFIDYYKVGNCLYHIYLQLTIQSYNLQHLYIANLATKLKPQASTNPTVLIQLLLRQVPQVSSVILISIAVLIQNT